MMEEITKEIMNTSVLDVLLYLAGFYATCFLMLDTLTALVARQRRDAVQPNLTYFWRMAIVCLLAAIYLKL